MSFLKRIEGRFKEVTADEDDDDMEGMDQDEEDKPEEDDVYFTTSGHLGSKTSLSAGGKFVGEFNSEDEAERALVKWINTHKWFPNLWYVSDHGNISPYKLSEKNSDAIKM